MESNTSFDSAPSVGTGTALIVNPSTTSEKLYYAFTPTEDAFYTIESSERGSCTPSVSLYNSSKTMLHRSRNISSTDKNFRMVYHLSKGVKYYIETQCGSTLGSYKVTFKKTSDLSKITNATSLVTEENSYTSVVSEYGKRFLVFTPEATCSHTIESVNNGENDPQGWLYDSSGKLITSDNDNGLNKNFRLKARLTKGENYYVAVGFVNGAKGACDVNLAITTPEAPLTLTSSNVTGDSVKLTWTMPSGYSVDRWLLQKRVKGASQWENATATNTKPITVSGLSANTTYEFRVISEAGAPAWQGVHSEPSTTLTVRTLPAQPTNLTVGTLTGERITFTWSTASPHGADRWRIEYKSGTSAWQTAGYRTYKGFEISGLSASTAYAFRVFAERDETDGSITDSESIPSRAQRSP